MNDLLPPDSARWQFFESACRAAFERHGYTEIRTPIVESTALFSRGIGDNTDIVEKEMYTFPDRKDRSLTMRPEMTASCARAYIQHALHKKEPVTRWYYLGPMFRYERMQTGRYRQFYQVGVEAYGAAEASLDAEQVSMLFDLYTALGISSPTVHVNTVGTEEDRPAYREALVSYFTAKKDALCGDCQRRLQKNPLRLLDCKVAACQPVIQAAPCILDHLGAESLEHFAQVKKHLEAFEVPFAVTPRLVRGLDYYTGTVFEITGHHPSLGAQSTLVGGGRYNGLIKSLGGPDTPAVGFALGVERNVMCLPEADDQLPRPDVFIVTRGDAARTRAMPLARELRQSGLRVDLEHRSVGVKAQFKRADKLRARALVTIGDDELAQGTANLRPMDSREEEAVPMAELVTRIPALLA